MFIFQEDEKPISEILEEFKTLIQPVPKDKGDTFNRASYEVSALLTKRTEECNKVITKFLDACLPHVRKNDVQCILERLKTLLCQTNLHFLASYGFQHTVIQMTRDVQANGTAAYVHLKDLIDELRAHREKKPEKAEQLCNDAPPPAAGAEADSQASTSGVNGCSNKSSALAGHPCYQCVSNDNAANTPPAAEALGSQGNRPGPQSPLSAASMTAAQTPHSSTFPVSSISVGERPGTSGLVRTVGCKRPVCRPMERKVKEPRPKSCAGDLRGEMGPSSPNAEKIENLQQYLWELYSSINKLREEEVDLKKDDEASAYIQEDRLMKRAWKIWLKLCKLEGRSPKTGKRQEDHFKFKGTRYPALNAAVEKLVNKKIFPDFTDICNVVKRVNELEDLELGTREAQTIAEEVFTSVGQELQRRRQLDELRSVMAYVTGSSFFAEPDPAESDPELKAKLEANAMEYRNKMDDVIQAYVNKQQQLKLEPQEVNEEDCDRSPQPDGNNSSEDEEGDTTEDDMTLEKDLLPSGSFSEGEPGAKDEAEVSKALCAASSSASPAGEESSKKSPVAGAGLGLAPTNGPNSAAECSVKPNPEGPSISGHSRDSSGMTELNNGPVYVVRAPADITITPVPAVRGTAELTITPVPMPSGPVRLNISPLPVSSVVAGFTTAGELKHGTKNGSIATPEVSIFPVLNNKLICGPKDVANGQTLPVKRRRYSSKQDEEDVITILSDDEVSVPPAKISKC